MISSRRVEKRRYSAQGTLQKDGQTVQSSVEVEIQEGVTVLTAQTFGDTSTTEGLGWWEGTLTIPAPVYLTPGRYTLVLTDGRAGDILVKQGGSR